MANRTGRTVALVVMLLGLVTLSQTAQAKHRPYYQWSYHDYGHLGRRWSVWTDHRRNKHYISYSNGHLNLNVKHNRKGTWKGSAAVLEMPFTYGRVVVRVKSDPGPYTKTAMMLWPANHHWPPEIDFMEMGDWFWRRQQANQSVHFGSFKEHRMVHNSYQADMTRWHDVGVIWRKNRVSYLLDGHVMRTIKGRFVPDEPMKLHLSVTPTKHQGRHPHHSIALKVRSVKVFK